MMENVDFEDVELGEDKGLVRILNDKEKQIDLLKEKIQKVEKENDKFDNMGKFKKDKEIDFEFDLEGISMCLYIQNCYLLLTYLVFYL